MKKVIIPIMLILGASLFILFSLGIPKPITFQVNTVKITNTGKSQYPIITAYSETKGIYAVLVAERIGPLRVYFIDYFNGIILGKTNIKIDKKWLGTWPITIIAPTSSSYDFIVISGIPIMDGKFPVCRWIYVVGMKLDYIGGEITSQVELLQQKYLEYPIIYTCKPALVEGQTNMFSLFYEGKGVVKSTLGMSTPISFVNVLFFNLEPFTKIESFKLSFAEGVINLEGWPDYIIKEAAKVGSYPFAWGSPLGIAAYSINDYGPKYGGKEISGLYDGLDYWLSTCEWKKSYPNSFYGGYERVFIKDGQGYYLSPSGSSPGGMWVPSFYAFYYSGPVKKEGEMDWYDIRTSIDNGYSGSSGHLYWFKNQTTSQIKFYTPASGILPFQVGLATDGNEFGCTIVEGETSLLNATINAEKFGVEPPTPFGNLIKFYLIDSNGSILSEKSIKTNKDAFITDVDIYINSPLPNIYNVVWEETLKPEDPTKPSIIKFSTVTVVE